MGWVRNLKIEVKFIGAFVLVASIAIVVGFIGIRNMSTINDIANRINEKELMGLSYTKGANIELIYLARAEKNVILAASDQDRQKFVDQAKKSEAMFLENLQKAKPLFYSEKGKELLAKAEKAWEDYIAVHKQVLDLSVKESLADKSRANELAMGLASQKIDVLDGVLTELTKIKENNSKNLSISTARIYTSSRTFMIVLSVAGFVLGIGMGILMTLSITRPIKRIIDGLSEGADQVSAASGQVSSASQELAEGASEQAASIEETSSSLEEMASMTKQNAGNANQANQLVADARETVSRAIATMAKLTTSMGEISKASEETSKIIKTIDEIAFQTNLLALNAAVEAARAGEAGAGFAVVADEVRNLAMRAAEAAKNTADLIGGTVRRVKEGSDLVEKTDEEFCEVATSVGKSGHLVGEISAASQEQAQGIEQVNKAVCEMDKVVQKNAANAEETASASEEMNAQAGRMKDFVEELITLVGGANGNRTLRNGEPVRTGKALMRTVASSAKPAKFRGAIGNGKANGKEHAHYGKRPSGAEQVFPLDDADISEF